MSAKVDEIKFDPGFAPLVTAFSGAIDYVYADINKYNNLSQKKVKFMQYYKKLVDMFYNNVGFYVGCLMWAVYIKTLPEGNITGNSCYGEIYREEDNTYETQKLSEFAHRFPKDMKYFLGKDFKFDDEIIKLIKIYEEFLILNKGFTSTQKNTDVILPEEIKIKDEEKCKEAVFNAINTGDLAMLKDFIKDII